MGELSALFIRSRINTPFGSAEVTPSNPGNAQTTKSFGMPLFRRKRTHHPLRGYVCRKRKAFARILPP